MATLWLVPRTSFVVPRTSFAAPRPPSPAPSLHRKSQDLLGPPRFSQEVLGSPRTQVSIQNPNKNPCKNPENFRNPKKSQELRATLLGIPRAKRTTMLPLVFLIQPRRHAGAYFPPVRAEPPPEGGLRSRAALSGASWFGQSSLGRPQGARECGRCFRPRRAESRRRHAVAALSKTRAGSIVVRFARGIPRKDAQDFLGFPEFSRFVIGLLLGFYKETGVPQGVLGGPRKFQEVLRRKIK